MQYTQESIAQIFGSKLRCLRCQRQRKEGLSLPQIAKKIGVTGALLERLERGDGLPSGTTLAALCTYFGVSPSQFYTAPQEIV